MTTTRRVLVVDDDAILRLALVRMLTREGIDCDCAADGREGLERVATGVYDLVITDMRMPHMTGLELIRAASAILDPLPRFILLSGYHDAPDEALVGVTVVLAKPLHPRLLRDHVREALAC
ncbi:response regulator [Nannocystaceae bacterium ST9]